MRRTTDVRRRLAVVLCLVAWAGLAAAHQPARPAGRELVRLQGHRADAKAGAGVTSMTVTALGAEHPFAASDVRTFGFGEGAGGPVGARVVLQGSRDVLSRFTGARADQLVTILAERRAGAADLFVLTIDLCPAR